MWLCGEAHQSAATSALILPVSASGAPDLPTYATMLPLLVLHHELPVQMARWQHETGALTGGGDFTSPTACWVLSRSDFTSPADYAPCGVLCRDHSGERAEAAPVLSPHAL